MTATIFTKPHLAHWMIIQFGNPVILPRDYAHKATLFSCLSKEVITVKDLVRVDIYTNKNVLSTFGHTIAENRIKYITRLLNEDMDRLIYDFVNANHEQLGSIDAAIAFFQERMKFNEDLFAFDAIRQRYYRYKRKLKIISTDVSLKLAS